MENDNKKLKDFLLLFIFLLLMKSLLAIILFAIFIFNNFTGIRYKNYILFFFSIIVVVIIYLLFPREADIDRVENYFFALNFFREYAAFFGLGTSGSIGQLMSYNSVGLESSLFYFFNDFNFFSILFVFYEYFFTKSLRLLSIFLLQL